MVLLMLIMVLSVVVAQDTSPAASSKIQTLEKQIEILTNLVHAQSNIMSKFSCSSNSESSPSECILKIANQSKKIAKLEGDLNALQSVTKSQGSDIQQLQTTVSDLSQKLKAQGTKLTSLDNKYASEVSKLRSEIQDVNKKTTTLTSSVSQLGTKIQNIAGQWPSGSYCILASGSCPAGFSRSGGHMRAINMYAASGAYIKQATFGDSKIQCHGNCGQYGNWIGDLYIYACCK